MKHLLLFLTCASFLALGACNKPAARLYEQQLFAFGTLVDIQIYAESSESARQAVQAVDALFQRQHHNWHAWQRGQLDSLNQAIAGGHKLVTDASIIELIRLGQHYERLSTGLFNPAIGQLLRLWGFQQDEPGRTPPDDSAIRQWRQRRPSSLDVQINGTSVSSLNTAVRLDFGGFAKGYSVNSAVELLENRGFHNLMVNAGGDLCLRGRHGERPWRVGIRAADGSGVLARLDLEGAYCVFTSGDYERNFEFQGKRYHHILDPRTGYPAVGTRSVTVVADDATLADAAATALFVAGPSQWQEIARRMGIHDVLLIDSGNNAQLTGSIQSKIEFIQPPEQVEVVRLDAQQHL